MKNLQKLIEEKAENKLKADIRSFLTGVHDNPIFKPLAKLDVKIVDDKFTNMSELFWGGESYPGYKMIYNALLPEYIERESKAFVDQVEQLSQSVEDLLNRDNY